MNILTVIARNLRSGTQTQRFPDRQRPWAYDPSRCTYCGLCVSYCPVSYLWQAADRGSAYFAPGEQAETIDVIKVRNPLRGVRPTDV